MTRKKHQDTVLEDAIADARGETTTEPELLDLDAPPPPAIGLDSPAALAERDLPSTRAGAIHAEVERLEREHPPLRIVTLEGLATTAQLAYIRSRGEPREDIRWQAAVRAVLGEFGAVNRGEAEPDGDLFTAVELG